MLPESYYLFVSIVFGLIFGSFLNVCIHRIPKGFTLGGRSACPKCRKQIPWHDNVPVLSYLALRGACRSCKARISIQYPLVEALTALLSVLTLLNVGYNLTAYFIWFLLFVCPLIVISFIDMRHRIIPDVISLPGILLGFSTMLYFRWPDWQSSLSFSLLGVLSGGGTLYVLGLLYYLIRKREGMGGGDVKLAAMLGAFLGWQAIVFVFLMSSIIALIYAILAQIFASSTKSDEPMIIPYGPFLACAALIYFFYGSQIKALYFSSLGIPS